MGMLTSFLKLIKPSNGEYEDSWDDPMNANSDAIDAFADSVNKELIDARFGKTSVQKFLEVGHNSDGTNMATTEIKRSRVSFQYGDEDESSNDILLDKRLNILDEETFRAKETFATLRDSLASRELCPDKVISGAKNGSGDPAWLGFTGTNVNVDGSVVPLWMMIGGYRSKIRSSRQISISGASGTRYLYSQFSPTGLEVVDESSQEGTVGSDGTKVRILDDGTKDFTALNVKPGDILHILGTTLATGMYVIREIAPGGNNNQLKIWGSFPSGALTGLDYKINDPVGLQLGYDDSKVPAAGKFYFGEAEFDGAGITSVTPIYFNDYYIGDWRPVDLTTAVDFLESWNHLMFDDALSIDIQVSQENDGSVPIETLSVAGMSNTLAPNVSNTLTLDPAQGSGGDQSLEGEVNVSLDGEVYLNRSAIAWYSNKQISVKNNHSGLFYKDYQGNDRQVGYIRVLVRKIRK